MSLCRKFGIGFFIKIKKTGLLFASVAKLPGANPKMLFKALGKIGIAAKAAGTRDLSDPQIGIKQHILGGAQACGDDKAVKGLVKKFDKQGIDIIRMISEHTRHRLIGQV